MPHPENESAQNTFLTIDQRKAILQRAGKFYDRHGILAAELSVILLAILLLTEIIPYPNKWISIPEPSATATPSSYSVQGAVGLCHNNPGAHIIVEGRVTYTKAQINPKETVLWIVDNNNNKSKGDVPAASPSDTIVIDENIFDNSVNIGDIIQASGICQTSNNRYVTIKVDNGAVDDLTANVRFQYNKESDDRITE